MGLTHSGAEAPDRFRAAATRGGVLRRRSSRCTGTRSRRAFCRAGSSQTSGTCPSRQVGVTSWSANLHLQKLLEQRAAVVGALAVARKHDGSSFIPVGQIMLNAGHVAVRHLQRGNQRIAEAENANVRLAVAWCVKPSNRGENRRPVDTGHASTKLFMAASSAPRSMRYPPCTSWGGCRTRRHLPGDCVGRTTFVFGPNPLLSRRVKCIAYGPSVRV